MNNKFDKFIKKVIKIYNTKNKIYKKNKKILIS